MEILYILLAIAILLLSMLAMLVYGAAMLLEFVGAIIVGVPFIPIPRYVVEKVITLAPREDGMFYDLGSGDGRVVFAVARTYPDMKAIGIDKAPLPGLITWLFRKWQPKNAHILNADFKNVSLAEATFVYMYLLTKISHELEPKLTTELKSGARLVTCDFPLKIKQPSEIIPVSNRFSKHTLYVYDF